MKLYLAGPMRGEPDLNRPDFNSWECALRSWGYDVVNPHNIAPCDSAAHATDGPWPDEVVERCLRRDAIALLECDGVALLDGWGRSQGASFERNLARTVGIPALPVGDWPRIAGVSAAVEPSDDSCPEPPAETGETRYTDPETGGAKGNKLARFDLIPADPLWQVAECYGRGALKYADRNWERGYPWHLSFAAMQRHANLFWAGEDRDPESGSHHLAAVVFHALALIEFGDTHPEKDDRPPLDG